MLVSIGLWRKSPPDTVQPAGIAMEKAFSKGSTNLVHDGAAATATHRERRLVILLFLLSLLSG
jgi:hypothetical protein